MAEFLRQIGRIALATGPYTLSHGPWIAGASILYSFGLADLTGRYDAGLVEYGFGADLTALGVSLTYLLNKMPAISRCREVLYSGGREPFKIMS